MPPSAAAVDPYRLDWRETGGRSGRLAVRDGEILDMTVAAGRLLNVESLVEQLRAYHIIYIGEQHDHIEHHRWQSWLIAALSTNRALVVGLEMLPRGSQSALDDYLRGRIDERELLRRSGWYRHWGYDFRYYRPVFRLARDRGFPLIALNVPNKTVRRVSREGIEALDPAVRRWLPQLDFGCKPHRAVFAALIGGEEATAAHKASFDRLYQAQVVRDAAMATALLAARKATGESAQMVALTGSGHLVYGLGISRQVELQAPTVRQRIVVPVSAGPKGRTVALGLADLVIGTAQPGWQNSYPRLGVAVHKRGAHLEVRRMSRGDTPARAAGVRVGDRIVAIDGQRVGEAFDVYWAMQAKGWGNQVVLGLSRGEKPLRRTLHLRHPEAD